MLIKPSKAPVDLLGMEYGATFAKLKPLIWPMSIEPSHVKFWPIRRLVTKLKRELAISLAALSSTTTRNGVEGRKNPQLLLGLQSQK